MRTTINIDDPILNDLKKLQKKERKSLGRLVSDLLAEALHQRELARAKKRPRSKWISRPMHARVEIADKDALYAAMKKESLSVGKVAEEP
jgi:mRNA-degrading endonuclease RelE of RelBE toxin-antitoxin system